MASGKKQPRQERRKPGTGTIRYKKGRDLPWEAAFPLEHGQYRYDYFSTRSEAGAHLDRLASERDHKEQPRNIAGGSQRVDTFLMGWLDVKRPHVKEKTILGYIYLCELASGQIGMYRLDEITRKRADDMFAYFYRRGFKNISQMRSVLRQAFAYAQEEDYITKNPFDRAKAPSVERRKAIALTREQRTELLNAFRRHPFEALFHLYSRLGLRRGEGSGLRWADFNRKERTLTIATQLSEVRGRPTRTTPKTKRSIRIIPLPPDVFDLIVEHYDWQRKHAARNPKWKENGLMFPTRHGNPIYPSSLLSTFKRVLRCTSIPQNLTIHDLRHTAEYLLEQDGIPLSTRMALLGHSTAAMAGHYADHADMAAMRYAVDKAG